MESLTKDIENISEKVFGKDKSDLSKAVKKDTKSFVFVKLKVINGEYEYRCYHVEQTSFKVTGNTLKMYAHTHAKHFYDSEVYFDKDSAGNVIYYFYGGEVAVTVEDYIQITKEEYNILKKFI